MTIHRGAKRVLHVTVGLGYGGVERALLDLAVAQRDAGVDVGVLTLRRSGPIGAQLEQAGLPLWGAGTRRRAEGLAEFVDGSDDVVMHSHLHIADAFVRAWSAAHPRIARVATWHAVVSTYRFGRVARATARALYGGFDAVTAVSESVRASFEPLTGVRATVVPNAVKPRAPDAAALAAAVARFPHNGHEGLDERATTSRSRPLRLVTLGRLVDEKRVDLVIDALSSLASAHLVIVGEGPARVALEARARARGVGGRVTFVGARPDPEAWLAAADVVVMPSEHEGMGLVAIEAAAAGTPLAATRRDGLADILADCPAPAIASLDAGAVAAAVAGCLEPSLLPRYRSWAAEAVDRYSPAAVQRALAQVYEDALAHAAGRS